MTDQGGSPLHRRGLSPDEHLSTDEMALLVDELEHVDVRSSEKTRHQVLSTLNVLSERMLGRDRPKDDAVRARIATLRDKVTSRHD